MNLDVLFADEIGQLGRQQIKYCLGICLFNLYGAWHMLQYTFVGYEVDFSCTAADQDTPGVSQCPDGGTGDCQLLDFPDIERESTIVSEWQLVCERSSWGPFTMSVFMSGVMIGALILGSLADMIGRRKTLGICLSMMVLSTMASALVGDYVLYSALKFIDGFFCSGYILSCFVLINELIGSGKRGLVGNVLQGWFSIGILVYSLAAYYVRHWRRLTALSATLGLPLLGVVWYLPESPRWLLNQNRTEEGLRVLRRIAVGNGTNLKSESKLLTKTNDENEPKKLPQSSILALFKKWPLFVLTSIQIYSWFVNSCSYYGLTLAAASSGNEERVSDSERYLSTALSGAVEIPAYVLAYFLVDQLGRKWTLCGFMIAGGSAAVVVIISPAFLVNGLALFAKLCVAASFSVVYIHSGEIFPTSIRNGAMGVVSVAARFGGILAPFVAHVSPGYPASTDGQYVVFGGLMLTAGLLNMRLPETKDEELPETVADMLDKALRGSSTPSGSPGTAARRRGKRYEKLSTEEFDEDRQEEHL